MHDLFPQLSTEQVRIVCELSSCSSLALTTLLDGLSLESLREMVYRFQIKSSHNESPRIKLEADDDDDAWVEAAVGFYKSPKFKREAEVRV